jgi:hypothetical protein
MPCQNRPSLDGLLQLIYLRMERHRTESDAPLVEMVMAEEIKNLTPEEARLREIEVLERLATLYRAVGKGGALPEAAITATADNAILARLPTQDAIIEFLRTADGPKKPSQACRALVEAAHEFAGADPMAVVKSAFQKLAANNNDMIYIGSGKWTLASKYTAAKLKKLKSEYSGRGGRSTEDHAKRTRDAMVAKGLTFGRKPKFGPDDIAKFRHLVDNKIKRPIAALEEVGISTPYYYHYKEQIYAWKPGDPWPPGKYEDNQPPGVSGDELRAMGIIPLNARMIGEKE